MAEGLDRRIPYKNIIMKCERWESRFSCGLPEGYHFTLYRNGDENEWAKLEYGTGDFESLGAAREYFMEKYGREPERIKDCCVFVKTELGETAASCIAWYDNSSLMEGSPVASLHWLVTAPYHQGKGIGMALTAKVMKIFESRGEYPVYLHTQPWSYKAVRLYLRCGFDFTEETFGGYVNQNEEALKVPVLASAVRRA